MLKKVIKYEDYNGETREKECYFSLSKSELMKMELGMIGGLEQHMQKIVAHRDTPAMLKLFEDIVLNSYGEKSADGERFIKSKELSEAFSQSAAYDALFMELVTDEAAATAFVKGVVPSAIAKELAKEENKKLIAPVSTVE